MSSPGLPELMPGAEMQCFPGFFAVFQNVFRFGGTRFFHGQNYIQIKNGWL